MHLQREVLEASGDNFLKKNFSIDCFFYNQVICLVCKGTSSHSCDHCEKLFQSGWQLREHLKDLHGEVIVEEEEKMVTRRRSSRLGRSSNLQNAEEDELEDEISIWDDFGEETEMFGEDEEGRYTDSCRRKRCVVKILQMKNFGKFKLR